MFELKKIGRHTSIHRRHLSMPSNEQVVCRKLNKAINNTIKYLERETIVNNLMLGITLLIAVISQC